VAEQVRRALDTLVLSGNSFSYPAVLEQDKAWRGVLEDVPDVFREGPVAGLSARVQYERACLHEDVRRPLPLSLSAVADRQRD